MSELGKKEIKRFMEEAVGSDIEEMLETWNINQEDVAEWIANMSWQAIMDMLINRDPRLTISTAYLIGLEIGYKLCLENETRRIAHDQT